ncbi:MAG TPA: cation transporter [Jiangellaceae bacterium]
MTVRDELALTDVSQVSTTNAAASDATLASAGCSCCATDAGTAATAAATAADSDLGTAPIVVADYTVTGMTCGHCVAAVTEEVSALAGVVDVKVELSSGQLTVTSDAPVADELVRGAVEEAGYQLT